ncbi:hypothetical protein ACXZ9C_11840 [Streptococcus agalactiae]
MARRVWRAWRLGVAHRRWWLVGVRRQRRVAGFGSASGSASLVLVALAGQRRVVAASRQRRVAGRVSVASLASSVKRGISVRQWRGR